MSNFELESFLLLGKITLAIIFIHYFSSQPSNDWRSKRVYKIYKKEK